MNLTESVKVVVRCRALSKRELESTDNDDPEGRNQLAVQFLPERNQIAVIKAHHQHQNNHHHQHQDSAGAVTSRSFTFDAIYALDSTTEQIYNEVAFPIVESAFEGYNGTIFAYGQTGCGKSYTMQGDFINNNEPPTGNQGIIQRAFEHILEAVAATKDFKFLLRTSFIEIYNDEIHDLLAVSVTGQQHQNASRTTTATTSKQSLNNNNGRQNNNVKLDLKRSTNNRSDHDNLIEGLTIVNVKTLDDCLRVVRLGLKNRSVSATLMNSDSSRSHSILTVYIERIRYIATTDLLHSSSDTDHMTTTKDSEVHQTEKTERDTENGQSLPDAITCKQQIRRGKLHLVDLAGSERLSRTGAIGDRLKEATKINLSLSALGNVISSVAMNAQHVPYRDSKLTRLLQDSLGGNAKTLMIACIAPTFNDYHETLCTLAFARRAKCIKNKPVINQDATDSILESYKNEIDRLRSLLAKLEQATAKSQDSKQQTDKLKLTTEIELDNLIGDQDDGQLILFDSSSATVAHDRHTNHNNDKTDDENLSKDKLESLDQMRSKTLERLNKLQSQLVGGERADDEDIKMRRHMRAKMAKRKFDALNRALAKLNDDDQKLVRAFGDISQELATKSDILRDSEVRIANLEQEISELTREYELDRSDMVDKIYKQSQEIKFFKQLAEFIYNLAMPNTINYVPLKVTHQTDKDAFDSRPDLEKEDSSSVFSSEEEVKNKTFKSFTQHVRSLSNWSEFEQKWLLPDEQKLQITQDKLPETVSLCPINGAQRSYNNDILMKNHTQHRNPSVDASSRFWQKLQDRNSKESLIAYFKLNTTSHLLSGKR